MHARQYAQKENLQAIPASELERQAQAELEGRSPTARALLDLQSRRGNHYVQQVVGQLHPRPARSRSDPFPLEQGDGYLPINFRQGNRTGLPDVLKAGVESLSGLALDDVRVHYNSPRPAQMQASAYTQGTDIYVAPGQERHLPHEAWHVIQQKQGRVHPTMQMKGIKINEEDKLEGEAETMGPKTLWIASHHGFSTRGASFHPSLDGNFSFQPRLSYPSPSFIDGHHSILQFAKTKNSGKPGPRSITSPITHSGHYFFGWLLDLADLWARGKVYDSIALYLAVFGRTDKHGPGWAPRAEEVVRFILNHPEVLPVLITALSGITAYLGIPPVPILSSFYSVASGIASSYGTLFSRGASSDLIGGSLLSYVPGASYFPEWLTTGLARRLGKSVINRVLTALSSIGGGSAVSLISRVMHGYSVTAGAKPAKGESMPYPKEAFGGFFGKEGYFPLERLHIIPAIRQGEIKTDNAAYGSIATNSLMIANEAKGHSAVAIQSPIGVLDAMGMIYGLFLGRGIRPREGFIEHWLASWGWA